MPAPYFPFIRGLCASLTEVEIAQAEARFARLLDILAEVAAHEAERAGDNRFDETEAAP